MKTILTLIALTLFTSAASAQTPNVILILTDDQGYGDLATHGNPVLKTPNMDRLASESVRFTDFHVAPMCSPTRGQLMTGIDAMRNGCTAVCQGRSMMRSEIPTMANYFADSGYVTGHFGKWHLGDSYPHRPQDRGFQETLHHRAWGITSLADYWGNTYFDPVLEHNGKDKKYEGYCTDIFFGEAMKWIDKQVDADEPFFCYLPTNTPHVPDICAEKYSDQYEGEHDGHPMPSKFYGMIANLDENLGKLESFLKRKGMRENTLLIYMSDNGTQSTEASELFNAGMRAKKTSVYEGGHRVPLFVRWPAGELQHGSACDELTQVQDLLPTLIELCDLKLANPYEHDAQASDTHNASPYKHDAQASDTHNASQYKHDAQASDSHKNHSQPQTRADKNAPPGVSSLHSKQPKLDGVSLAGLLKDTSREIPDRKLVIQYRTSGERWDPAVVMWDKWRLLQEKKGRRANTRKKAKERRLELYHVGRDPGQTKNVAADHPEIVQAMSDHYESWHSKAAKLFAKRRWITIGSRASEPATLYAQDWVGDYCDNPKGLSQSTAKGHWDVNVSQAGVYEIELRRWPKESGKTLIEGWEGPEDKGPSARPIVAASLEIAGHKQSIETDPADSHASFRVRLPAGKTQLSTSFLDRDGNALCSAIYTQVQYKHDAQASERNTSRTHTSPHAKPNVVLFFIDDMGYGDIGPFGNKDNKTPNLDRMAKEGNILRQFYVANTACTPSRAALLTGTYAARIGMDGQVCFPGENRGLNPSEITIAEMLKATGYVTGCFGKWHLGDQPEFLPLKQGFDQYFGIPYSNDMWPGNKKGNPLTNRQPYTPLPVILQDQVVAHVSDGADQSLLCEVVTAHTEKFIEKHKDEPFFCYVPHAYVHHPRYARPDLLKLAGGDINRTNVEEIDTSVGRVLDKLRELNLDQKTLVIFTSDNGGASGMSMGPLRGGKGGAKYEGHMREPTITWWPGTIPAGVESNEIGVTTDLLPSLARLTGAEVPHDRKIDGKDVLDILLGKPDSVSPHRLHYYEAEGIRRGPWKLVRRTTKKGESVELYNLDDDIGEKKDLAYQKKELVSELRVLLAKHAKAITANTRPAGFVAEGTAKPLISETAELPKLRDYMRMGKTTATGPAKK